VTGGYDWARSEDLPVAASLRTTGHNWGIYGLFGMANGLYGGLIYKRDNLDVSFFNGGRGIYAPFNDVHVDGVDGEVGLKSTAGSIGFDVQAGLSYVKTNMGTGSQQGLDFGWTDNKSLRGRVGGRIIFPPAMGAFIGAKLYHEFKDDALFRVTSAGTSVADIVMPHRGTWTRIEGGVDALGINGALFTLWGDLGDTKSFGGRLGFRF